MHIKKVIIKGLRVVRELECEAEFDEGFNIIIGENGSGKSTIFDAIRFVVSDSTLVPESERAKMFWSDGGQRSSLVDITVVFDNSDGRLQAASKEVSIRRVVGTKKDEHFLNDKSVSRSDVISLLETAGFSRHNPHYMVEQGRVNDFAAMKDSARFELLKQVAGTSVYEQRRRESLRILAETERKRRGIEEVIESIDARLSELNSERSELEEYLQLDKQRRALEYTLHQRRLDTALAGMSKTDAELADARAQLEDQQTQMDATRAAMGVLQRVVDEGEARLASLREEHEQLLDLEAEASRAHVALSEKARALRSEVAADARSAEETAAELARCLREIDDRERRVREEHAPAVERVEARHRSAVRHLQDLEARAEQLLAKQGRESQFKTAKERDAWIRKEVKAMEAQIAEAAGTRAAASAEAGKAATEASAAEAASQAQDAKAASLLRSVDDELQAQLIRTNTELTRNAAERAVASSAAGDIERDLKIASQRRDEATERLWRGVPAAVRAGIEEVRRAVEERAVTGVHGPLVELIEVKEQLDVAVEQVAGKRLFNVVVDDERVGAALLRRLSSAGRGVITCMPLSRLNPMRPRFPEADKHPDVSPLIKFIRREERVDAAVREVFGSVLLCKDETVASKYASPAPEGFGLDCITTDGFKRDADGSIYGGYVDIAAVRLGAERDRRAAAHQVAELSERLAKATASVTALEQLQTRLRADKLRLESEVKERTDRAMALRRDAQRSRASAEDLRRRASEQERRSDSARASEEDLRSHVEALSVELGTPLSSELSADEQAELARCTRESEDAREAVAGAASELAVARAALTEQKSALEQRLHPQAAEYRARLDGAAGGTGGQDAAERRTELQEAESLLEAAVAHKSSIRDRIKELTSRMGDTSNLDKTRLELEKMRSSEASNAETVKTLQTSCDHLWRQRSLAAEKKLDSESKLRDLGTVPGDQMDKFRSLAETEIVKQLGVIGKKLARFSHVNKKALLQWQSFSRQREALLERKDECDRGDRSIHLTIEHLDREKDKAILRTFREVSRHFSAVFRELVPAGSGRMVLLAKEDGSAGDDVGGEEVPLDGSESASLTTASSLGVAEAAAASSSVLSSSSRRSSLREVESDSAELDLIERRLHEGVPRPSRRAASPAAPAAAAVSEVARRGKRGRGAGAARDAEDDDAEHSLASSSELDQFYGVAIKVAFTAGEPPKHIGLFSGGQKTMIALGLIFAIQRCDPAPFYLFDEIDQSLDPTARSAVAELIKRQASDPENPAQFFLTSFRTSTLMSGHKWFFVRRGYTTVLENHTLPSAMTLAQRICDKQEAAAKVDGAPGSAARSSTKVRAMREGATAAAAGLVDEEM